VPHNSSGVLNIAGSQENVTAAEKGLASMTIPKLAEIAM